MSVYLELFSLSHINTHGVFESGSDHVIQAQLRLRMIWFFSVITIKGLNILQFFTAVKTKIFRGKKIDMCLIFAQKIDSWYRSRF